MSRAIQVILLTIVCCTCASAEFGEAVSGLQAGISDQGGFAVQIRNNNLSAIQPAGAFAWLLVVESREQAWYSDKLPLDQSIAPGQTGTIAPNLAQLRFHPYVKGIKVVDGYPQGDGESTALDSLPKSARVQAIAVARAGGERVTAKSRAVPFAVAATSQPADPAGLLQQFRRSAFGAQAAHDRALKIGADAAPTLLVGLQDKTMPDYGRMWIATALIDMGGETARNAAASLASDPLEGVRSVLAYHGPKRRDAAIDEVILARARSGDDPLFTAWAARGFSQQNRPFPKQLVQAACQSAEPRARAEVADVLAQSREPENLQRLAKLFLDDVELVRVGAADAVAKHPIKEAAVVNAMVLALEKPGESARSRIIQALSKTMNKSWVYDPQVPEEQRLNTLAVIRKWHSLDAKEPPADNKR